MQLRFGLLITPVKPLDPAHFSQRYYHLGPNPIEDVLKCEANIINIHHGYEINPNINYPFLHTDTLGAYIAAAHERDVKVKIYYTLRELTNHVAEMWALRSLGHEVLAPGSGGGYPWLREHLGRDYQCSWYEQQPDGEAWLVARSALNKPDDNFNPASDGASMFLGRVNRVYGTMKTDRPAGRYHGVVGYIYK